MIFDRTGQAIIVSDFRERLDGFDVSTNGVGSEVAIYGKYDNHYGPVVRIYAIDETNAYAQLIRYVPGLEPSILTLGLNIAITSEFNTIEFDITIRRSNVEYTYKFIYHSSNDTLRILVSGDTYTTVITNLRIDQEYYRFNYLRLSVDDRNGRYNSISINQTEYDLTSYTPPTTTVPAGAYITLNVKANGSDVAATEFFLETFILTLGELRDGREISGISG